MLRRKEWVERPKEKIRTREKERKTIEKESLRRKLCLLSKIVKLENSCPKEEKSKLEVFKKFFFLLTLEEFSPN